MTLIIMSQAALLDSARLSDFLDKLDPDAAIRAGEAIVAGISRLERFPESVPPFTENFRILTVPFGKRGYSVAYVYFANTDEVVILGIKHQSEEFFPFELKE
ncbi:type II toxin-antitoxin system RelE/ParE family toxin [Desulfovibrio sp. OttesenSCG-928-M14]|nr:type II toxin-antitoxin system RelE/ParE family toxin [Desulfovibrio sp. OttesenSCG-928-M14]